MTFTHLHVHSDGSFMDSTATPEALLQRAQALGMEALALTDRDSLARAVEFFQLAPRYGVRPLLGLQLSTCWQGPEITPRSVLLLVEDKSGYANLLRLLNAAHLERPRQLTPQLPWRDVLARGLGTAHPPGRQREPARPSFAGGTSGPGPGAPGRGPGGLRRTPALGAGLARRAGGSRPHPPSAGSGAGDGDPRRGQRGRALPGSGGSASLRSGQLHPHPQPPRRTPPGEKGGRETPPALARGDGAGFLLCPAGPAQYQCPGRAAALSFPALRPTPPAAFRPHERG
jgi:hypothetical protein